MQNWIIRYVEDLKAIIEPTGCSIASALDRVLPQMTPAAIQKLREGAADLERILALELMRRDEATEPAPLVHWDNGPICDSVGANDSDTDVPELVTCRACAEWLEAAGKRRTYQRGA